MDLPGARNRFTRAVVDFHDAAVPRLRQKFLYQDNIKALLEHHARAFILDELLDSTGWTTRPSGGDHLNLLSEAYFKKGYLKKHTLFFDYLGVDRHVNLPLLVFEAKRFGAAGPMSLVDLYERKTAAKASSAKKAKVKAPLEKVLALAMKLPAWVQGEWRDHLKQLKKYVAAAKTKFNRPPAVMAIGNGEWLLVIRDPEQVFAGKIDARSFLVVEEPGLPPGEAYRMHFDVIHGALAYERLAPAASYLYPEAIPPELLQAKNVEILRGVYLGYTSTRTPQRKGVRPHIDVTPMVFVRVAPQPWLSIRTEADGKTMPHEGKGSAALEAHLAEMETASAELMQRVAQRFTHALTEIDVVAHGRDVVALVTRPFVQRESPVAETATQSFVIVTGKHSHFLLPKPRVTTCPYHEWSNCTSFAVGQYPSGAPIAAPCYSGDRAFFPSGRSHHCAADVTYRTKAVQRFSPTVTGSDARTPADEVFCKIFDFESMLCCQTCVFFDVCGAAQTFLLPCMKPSPSPAQPAV